MVQLNVSLAWAITWLADVTIHCTFFNNNSPPPGQFLSNKILKKKKKSVTARKMLIEQFFLLSGPGGPLAVYVCTSTTGCFHHKTIVSKEIFFRDCYSLLKCWRRQYFPLPGPNHLQNLIAKCKIFNVFWT